MKHTRTFLCYLLTIALCVLLDQGDGFRISAYHEVAVDKPEESQNAFPSPKHDNPATYVFQEPEFISNLTPVKGFHAKQNKGILDSLLGGLSLSGGGLAGLGDLLSPILSILSKNKMSIDCVSDCKEENKENNNHSPEIPDGCGIDCDNDGSSHMENTDYDSSMLTSYNSGHDNSCGSCKSENTEDDYKENQGVSLIDIDADVLSGGEIPVLNDLGGLLGEEMKTEIGQKESSCEENSSCSDGYLEESGQCPACEYPSSDSGSNSENCSNDKCQEQSYDDLNSLLDLDLSVLSSRTNINRQNKIPYLEENVKMRLKRELS